eukprot:Pgem_evm1s5206
MVPLILLYKISNGDTFIDLGCGNGQVVDRVKRSLPQSRCIGIDMSVVEICKAKNLAGGEGEYYVEDIMNTELLLGNEMNWENVRKAKIVTYCYHPENWIVNNRNSTMNLNLYKGNV